MGNKIKLLLISLLSLVFMLTSCSYSITKTTNDGDLTKSVSDTITVDYFVRHKKGFPASLDFELTSGKVDWEITNPKNETVFKGYVLYENGKVYRELTYPLNYMNGNGSLNKKEEVKKEASTNGTMINMPNIFYLQFDTSISGKYTLKLKPEKAAGKYKITWLSHFPRK